MSLLSNPYLWSDILSLPVHPLPRGSIPIAISVCRVEIECGRRKWRTDMDGKRHYECVGLLVPDKGPFLVPAMAFPLDLTNLG